MQASPLVTPSACGPGIAWDEAKRELYVTGKYWSKLYEIKPMLQTATPTRQEVKAVRSRCIHG